MSYVVHLPLSRDILCEILANKSKCIPREMFLSIQLQAITVWERENMFVPENSMRVLLYYYSAIKDNWQHNSRECDAHGEKNVIETQLRSHTYYYTYYRLLLHSLKAHEI